MAELLMFEVDVKNVTKGKKEDQLGFGVLIPESNIYVNS